MSICDHSHFSKPFYFFSHDGCKCTDDDRNCFLYRAEGVEEAREATREAPHDVAKAKTFKERAKDAVDAAAVSPSLFSFFLFAPNHNPFTGRC